MDTYIDARFGRLRVLTAPGPGVKMGPAQSSVVSATVGQW